MENIDAVFDLKSGLEAQLASAYQQGPTIRSDGAFDFLLGQWELVRTSFDGQGKPADVSSGRVSARYTLEDRVIQEDFYNYGPNGDTFRAGTALYTYAPMTRQWHVAALDAAAGATAYQPVFSNGEVHYTSVIVLPQSPDTPIYTRSRIYNITRDSTEWAQQVSLDRVSWHANYHIYSRRDG